MTKVAAVAKDPSLQGRRRLQWKRIVGALLSFAILAWLLRDYDVAAMWRAVQDANFVLLLVAPPLILVNMMIRALRWRPLLGTMAEISYWPVFSALMIGYLANTILPVRAGDLVRIYVLGNDGRVSRSRILGTVLLERMLDMAAILLVLALVAIATPLPEWLRQGAIILAVTTTAGIAALFIVSFRGQRLLAPLLRLVESRWPDLGERAKYWAAEFSLGIQRFRNWRVALIFFSATAAIWALEIGLILLVAYAFDLKLTTLDAAILMLFSLFSSLIPALPGQLGTFELAMVSGLQFVGANGPSGPPFTVALHFLLLASTALIGFVCLVYSGLPLIPRTLVKRLEEGG